MRAEILPLALAVLLTGTGAFGQSNPAVADAPLPEIHYTPGPDSLPQPGVRKGSVFEFTLEHSKVFPGTSRTITVYVPDQYTADKPACLYIGLDAIVMPLPGLVFDVPVVFDNLIDQHSMPVTMAIGVSSGAVQSSGSPKNPRFNRSVEFDGLNGDLARFLIEEVIPEVERHNTPGGLPIRVSNDPNDRAIGGLSTGAIGAFTVAWERPDVFRRVLTGVGTFVGMRGADRYAVLVRKTEPKPIRIFMQDGSNDEWPGGPEFGDWWMSNQTMERALEFSGYSVEHIWGQGAHNHEHMNAIFPSAMRWLWKDWPHPVIAGESRNTFLQEILRPGEQWQPVQPGDPDLHAIAATMLGHRVLISNGLAYQTDSSAGKLWLVKGDGHKTLLDTGLKGPTGVAVSPDGLWLAVAESRTHWGYSYRIQPDGSVQDKERFYWFHVPDEADDSGAGAWVMDRDGRLYAATRMGVQVFDRSGRVRAILPIPGGRATGLTFGGAGFDTLYVTGADHKVFRRKFRVPGIRPGAAPIELPAWGPG
jgi:gluconolactonase